MYEHLTTRRSSPAVRQNAPYTVIMPPIWRCAKINVLFPVISFAAIALAPPPAPASLESWAICRNCVNAGKIAAESTIVTPPETWSAVVILRKDGRVVGIGSAHEKNPLLEALQIAIDDANRRMTTLGATPVAIPWEQITLEIELGSKPEPVIGATYLQAAREIQPALDGIAVRRGNEWALAHPAVLQSLNVAGAPDQTFLSLVMQLGLPARDFDKIPASERVALYRFETTRIVQPTPTMPPTVVYRGSRIEPSRNPVESVDAAHAAVEGIVQWFERAMIRSTPTTDAQPAGQRRALDALGLRGDYLPADGTDESINAAPAEQALAAYALARCATLNRADEALARRSRDLSLAILAALQDVADIERDPLANPKSIAWIVLASVELGNHLHKSPAAITLNANAKGLLAKMVTAAANAPAQQPASPPQISLVFQGDPLEQSLQAAALAALDHAGNPIVDRAALVTAIDRCWTTTSRSQIIGVFGWLLLADRLMGDFPSTHIDIARAARAALAIVQIGMNENAIDTTNGPVPPDLVGAFALTGIASKGATAQTARPGYGLALMLDDPTLTPVGEQFRARAMQMGVIRFLRQLSYDDAASYLSRDRERTIGGIKNAPWDSRVAIAGNAMALLCLEESAFSLKSLNSTLESGK